jgi:hypothetical protein
MVSAGVYNTQKEGKEGSSCAGNFLGSGTKQAGGTTTPTP